MAHSRPLTSDASEQGRQKNRRLELVIVQTPPSPRGRETSRDDVRLAAISSRALGMRT